MRRDSFYTHKFSFFSILPSYPILPHPIHTLQSSVPPDAQVHRFQLTIIIIPFIQEMRVVVCEYEKKVEKSKKERKETCASHSHHHHRSIVVALHRLRSLFNLMRYIILLCFNFNSLTHSRTLLPGRVCMRVESVKSTFSCFIQHFYHTICDEM